MHNRILERIAVENDEFLERKNIDISFIIEQSKLIRAPL